MGEGSGGLQDLDWGNMRKCRACRVHHISGAKRLVPVILLDAQNINSHYPFPPTKSYTGTRKPDSEAGICARRGGLLRLL